MRKSLTARELKERVRNACTRDPGLAERIEKRLGYHPVLSKMGVLELSAFYLAFMAEFGTTAADPIVRSRVAHALAHVQDLLGN